MTDNNEVFELLDTMDFHDEVELQRENVKKFSWSRLAELGIGVDTILKTFDNAGGSGLYFVDTQHKQMFGKKDTLAFIGSLKNVEGKVGGGQALMYPVAFDPTTLMIAVAMASIEKRLDDIEKGQKEIMEFMELKEKATIEADFNDLADTLRNYRYNWNVDKYKTNKHILVQKIKNDARKSLIMQRELIQSKFQKHNFVFGTQISKKILKEIVSLFKEYKKALFLYSYAAFVEILLLENYNEEFLNNVRNSILDYSYSYRELYTRCYDVLEKYSKANLGTGVVLGASKLTTLMGKAIEKVPVISDTQLDENLIKSGEKIKDSSDEHVLKFLNDFVVLNNPGVGVFADNIEVLEAIYNKKSQYFIDKDNLYVRMMA